MSLSSNRWTGPLLGGLSWRLAAMADTAIPFPTPDQISQMPAREKMLLAEQLFNEADSVRSEFSDRFRSLLEGPDDRRAEIHAALEGWLTERLKEFSQIEGAIMSGLTSKDESLFRNYSSSYWQPLAGINLGLANAYEIMRFEPQHFNLSNESVALLSHCDRDKRPLPNGRKIHVSLARGELAGRLIGALVGDAGQTSWHNDDLVLHLPEASINLELGYRILQGIAWPPDPQDTILQAFGRVLGWAFDVTSEGGQVKMVIDFGKNTIE